MSHRPEIDGLRALAVLPVIFFHAGFSAWQGGFIGVDVFFVISGYLITGLIHHEHQSRRFSMATFYERRIRRILPALYVVLLVCTPVAWWLLNASEFMNYSQSLASVPVFSSGLLFMFTALYFDASADVKPLLHTWSLGVEEQFYVFFPIVLGLLVRWRPRAVTWGVLALALGSFWLAVWGMARFPTSNFYLMPTRAWELLIGSVLALEGHRLARLPRPWRQAGGLAGLGLLAVGCLTFSRDLPWPSLYTLVPTLGTALILAFATPDTWAGRVLTWRLFVGVGLISYSAYLWHQPLFAFTRLALGDRPTDATMLLLIGAALALAWATWKYVETPCRDRQRGSRQRVFMVAGTTTLAVMAVGVAGFTHALPTRWEWTHPQLINHSVVASASPRQSCRHLLPVDSSLADCVQIGDGPRTVVLWGDSHANALLKAAQAWPDARLIAISHAGCPPLPGLRRTEHTDGAHVCHDKSTLEGALKLVESLHPDTVVLASRWTLYLKGWTYEGRPMTERFTLGDDQATTGGASGQSAVELLQRHLQALIDRLAQHSRVLVLTQPMDMSKRVFRDVESDDLTLSLDEVNRWHAPEVAMFQGLHWPANAALLDTRQLFCGPNGCPTRDHGTLLYKDDNHLSPRGASLVWQAIRSQDARMAAAATPKMAADSP
ncbi:MAG: hypothetical protein RI907_3557 [Pseudomonadota bacterium]|jgi:peptidoglycan/LPS O-acetylase OafA/YrhL